MFKWVGKAFKVLKWIAVAVAIAGAIAFATAFFAPANSILFKAAMWWFFKATPIISKYLGWAIGGVQTGSSLFTTPGINPGGGWWGNPAFPGGVTVDGGVLAIVQVKIPWFEKGVWRKVGNALEGFAESLTMGLPSAIDRWMGRDRGIDRNAPEYKGGEIVGTVTSLVIPGTAGAKAYRAGWKVQAGFYKHGGGGINVLKNGARKYAIDYHSFKNKAGKLVKKLHIHYGKTKNQMKKHRSIFTGKPM